MMWMCHTHNYCRQTCMSMKVTMRETLKRNRVEFVFPFIIFLSCLLRHDLYTHTGPSDVESRKITKSQSKQEYDDGSVIVDPVISVSNIQVFEGTTVPSSSEDNSQEVTTSASSAESSTDVVNVDDANPINRYCKCSSFECDCCRDFSLPIVPIRGPGCANLRYLDGDRLSIGIKFGNRVLANRVISGMNFFSLLDMLNSN